jgi:hypothetical protein
MISFTLPTARSVNCTMRLSLLYSRFSIIDVAWLADVAQNHVGEFGTQNSVGRGQAGMAAEKIGL